MVHSHRIEGGMSCFVQALMVFFLHSISSNFLCSCRYFFSVQFSTSFSLFIGIHTGMNVTLTPSCLEKRWTQKREIFEDWNEFFFWFCFFTKTERFCVIFYSVLADFMRCLGFFLSKEWNVIRSDVCFFFLIFSLCFAFKPSIERIPFTSSFISNNLT